MHVAVDCASSSAANGASSSSEEGSQSSSKAESPSQGFPGDPEQKLKYLRLQHASICCHACEVLKANLIYPATCVSQLPAGEQGLQCICLFNAICLSQQFMPHTVGTANPRR